MALITASLISPNDQEGCALIIRYFLQSRAIELKNDALTRVRDCKKRPRLFVGSRYMLDIGRAGYCRFLTCCHILHVGCCCLFLRFQITARDAVRETKASDRAADISSNL